MNQDMVSLNDPVNEEKVRDWTPGRIAAVVLLVALCSVLVWNAYHPEDIYISDLRWEVMQGDRFEPQKDTSVEGNTLTVGPNPTFYPRGVGVHANSEIYIRFLPNAYRFFVAEIGIDQETPKDAPSSVIFRIESDGTLMYESSVMRRDMLPRYVRVPIEGRNSLTLIVTDAGDGNEGDHADWAMARFTVR